jgi:hypothetical protein
MSERDVARRQVLAYRRAGMQAFSNRGNWATARRPAQNHDWRSRSIDDARISYK